jgi:DNA-binding protein HU-beta
MPDEFEMHAREVLGSRDKKLLKDLLGLRAKALNTKVPRSYGAKQINDQNQKLFDQAAQLLGPKRFELVFGFPADERVNLVDPALMEITRQVRPSSKSKVQYRAPTTVTIGVLASSLAKQHAMPKKEMESVIGDLVGNIVTHLKKGQRIRIGGLGILQVRRRAARIGRNPSTGQTIKIKSSKKVAFRASKELKEKI